MGTWKIRKGKWQFFVKSNDGFWLEKEMTRKVYAEEEHGCRQKG